MPSVPCPTCRKPTEFSSTNKYRPFCSERCSTIDLGSWATENYRVPGDPVEIEVNQKQASALDKPQSSHRSSSDSE